MARSGEVDNALELETESTEYEYPNKHLGWDTGIFS